MLVFHIPGNNKDYTWHNKSVRNMGSRYQYNDSLLKLMKRMNNEINARENKRKRIKLKLEDVRFI